MLEQSALHGRIFYSVAIGKTLASKPAAIADIKFGPMRPVQIYRISDMEMWVQDKNTGTWYHYMGINESGALKLESFGDTATIKGYASENGFFYYYGKALYKGKDQEETEQFYFVQNEPKVSYGGTPDISAMQMPLTIQALDYGQVFSYPEKIKHMLEGIPACYVDRYKRPIKRTYGRTYPIPMGQVKTTWANLPETTYPVAIDFAKTRFAVADLEPEHSEDDLAYFNKIPGYYEEDTPRGGKHKVICIKDSTFKFRYSRGLEIINQSQVTLYGINAKWLTDSPEVLDLSGCQPVGHTSHTMAAALLARPDVEEEVALLRKKAEENLSAASMVAKKLYHADPDSSHGEFVALHTLYKQDIEPYAGQFEAGLLPWILEQYAKDVIIHRDKHETLRYGLPYLVYLAAIIIGKKKVVQVWDDNSNQNYISSSSGNLG